MQIFQVYTKAWMVPDNAAIVQTSDRGGEAEDFWPQPMQSEEDMVELEAKTAGL